MLALLVLLFVGAAVADPVLIDKKNLDKKIIPLYEDALIPHNIADTRTALRAWCLDDCHHHIIDKPVMVVVKSSDAKWDVHYMPLGLNHMTKTSMTAPLKEMLAGKNMVGIISPMSRFPFELFPGMLDTDVLIPEHHNKLSFMYKEAPILVMLPEDEFKKFNEKRGYTPVADLSMDDIGFSVHKDYAQLYRSSILTKSHESAPGLYYLVPTAPAGHDFVPTTSGMVPLTSSEYIRYLSAARPVTNPALTKTFTFF